MRRCLVVLSIAVSACGGKILVESADASAAPGPSASSEPPSFAPPPEPAPEETHAPLPITIPDACAAFCERNSKCGKHTVSCLTDCMDTAGDSCNGAGWITCTGGTPGDRCNLPPACEQSYCSWAKCSGRAVPDYC